ncbi:MAG: hypothetical protein ACO4BW_05465 [Nitriliruptoraceae bacterium]|jgi:hypothetical protein
MVVGRERFTPRADVRGVATVVAIGLAVLGAAAVLTAAVMALVRLAGAGG